MNEILEFEILSFWLTKVLMVLLVFFLLGYGVKRLSFLLIKKTRKSTIFYHDIVIASLSIPLIWIFRTMGVHGAMFLILEDHDVPAFETPISLISIVYWSLFTWFMIRTIYGIERHYNRENQSNPDYKGDITTVVAIAKVLRITIYVFLFLICLDNLGFNINTVLAAGGIGGIAIGFASQDLLSNILGGVMLFFEKPFKIGDWIRSPDKDIEGTVEYIGLRSSLIRTFDSRPLYVPNATFTKISIENPSRMLNRRIYEVIGIRYCDVSKMATIVAEVKDMLKKHQDIANRKTLMVNFVKFGPSSLDFFIYCFTKTTNWQRFHEVKQDVLLKTSAIIAHNQAEVAFPTTTIHLNPEPPAIEN